MSKAFTRETDTEDEEPDAPDPLPAGVKNYMTPAGYAALRDELRRLLREERPRIVETVSWAAGNGDRSENGDYIYNKKRLREIDRRVRYLTKRLESAEVVDPQRQRNLEQVFFGATVRYARADGTEHTLTLVGLDEADPEHGRINWQSPVGKALLKARVGDTVKVRTAALEDRLEVLAIDYGGDV
jgi:transcription elongation factor GreB